MAVTRSIFRSFTSYINSPAQIIKQMNDSLSGEANDQNMFVTLFIGVLDLQSGGLTYCNAGHDAPICITSRQAKENNYHSLPVVPNLPLGVLAGFTFVEQTALLEAGDTLFLYTDGLTEAENNAHEQFGMERIERVIGGWNADTSADEQVHAMQQAVSTFVDTAEQSDDLTLFAIRMLSKAQTTSTPVTEGHFSLVMRNDIQQIPTLAEWIESIGVPEELNMPINLALEEAVSNVMLYAYPQSNNGRVLVEAEKTADHITFTITDSGIPFDPTKQKEADITLSVEQRAIGGLGIHLVRQIMDDIHYERKDDKNILTLVKKL